LKKTFNFDDSIPANVFLVQMPAHDMATKNTQLDLLLILMASIRSILNEFLSITLICMLHSLFFKNLSTKLHFALSCSLKICDDQASRKKFHELLNKKLKSYKVWSVLMVEVIPKTPQEFALSATIPAGWVAWQPTVQEHLLRILMNWNCCFFSLVLDFDRWVRTKVSRAVLPMLCHQCNSHCDSGACGRRRRKNGGSCRLLVTAGRQKESTKKNFFL